MYFTTRNLTIWLRRGHLCVTDFFMRGHLCVTDLLCGVSLTLNSLLLTQHKSSSPICVRVLNILGSVEKVCFVSSILVTEHLILLVHDIS
jgi:hypothetical protein